MQPEEPLQQADVKRRVKGLLNKITVENFASITDKLANLDLTEASASDLTDLVIERAVKEPSHCAMFADVCYVLKTRGSWGDPDFSGAMLDRLNRCLEQEVIKKMEGNVKFIGQLYLRELLSQEVVHEVVRRLVFQSDRPEEHYIECFCLLVRSIGATLESSDQAYMQQLASRMEDLLHTEYSKRAKCALQSVLELRSAEWEERVPQERVLRERVKTKDQARADAKREQHAQHLGVRNPFLETEIAGKRPEYILAKDAASLSSG